MSEPTPAPQTLSDPAPLPQSAPRSASPSEGATAPPPPPGPTGAATEAAPSNIGRYRSLGEIGQGGMGAVLRAHDPDLGRDLAIKVLRADYRGRADLERRFLEEAQVAAQLQHPGVAPVHEVGRLPDGRPYFAMKLVQGRTLAELLRERPDPAHDLPRFLQIFEQICQTLAFAHSKRVIHRDLKPNNVMVGRFGEVQVMDWGLAKVLAPCQAADAETASIIQTVRTEDGDDASRAGTVLGTPAYMAPEQARGEVERLDERCDVFGLGALLCEILTGRPPFTSEKGRSALSRAQQGDLGEALSRLDGCGADAELVRIARDCLALVADDRPRDAAEVSGRMTAYRTGVQERLRQAELERTAADARSEAAAAKARAERRARRLTVWLAAAIFAAVSLGAGAALWLWHRQTAHEAELTAAVEGDLGELSRAREQERWPDAWEALRRAESRLEAGGPEPLRQRLGQARGDLERVRRDPEMLARLEEARMRMALPGKRVFDWEGADRLYREAFAWYGLDVEGRPADEAAARVRASAIRRPLAAALHHWALAVDDERSPRLREVANRADPLPWRGPVREAIARQDWEAVRRLGRVAAAEDLSVNVVMLASTLQDAGQPGLALEVLREGHERRPADFWLAFELGRACHGAESPHVEDAVRYFSVARALRPSSAVVHQGLGWAWLEQGKVAEAVASFQEAVRLKPDWVEAQIALGYALRQRGRFSESLNVFRQAHELMDRDPDYSRAAKESVLQVRDVERLVELDGKLPAFLAGDARPADASEQIELAQLCYLKRLYASSARFYADAFASRPALADDPKQSHNYNAARSAALAGCGEGEGATQPDAQERARLRRQALEWLRADLRLRAKAVAGDKPADRDSTRKTLAHELSDPELAGVRDREQLPKLPEAEREPWRKLWADVEDLLEKAKATK